GGGCDEDGGIAVPDERGQLLLEWRTAGRVGHAGFCAVVRGHDAALCRDGVVRREPAWRREWSLCANCGSAVDGFYAEAGVFRDEVRAEFRRRHVVEGDANRCGRSRDGVRGGAEWR